MYSTVPSGASCILKGDPKFYAWTLSPSGDRRPSRQERAIVQPRSHVKGLQAQAPQDIQIKPIWTSVGLPTGDEVLTDARKDSIDSQNEAGNVIEQWYLMEHSSSTEIAKKACDQVQKHNLRVSGRTRADEWPVRAIQTSQDTLSWEFPVKFFAMIVARVEETVDNAVVISNHRHTGSLSETEDSATSIQGMWGVIQLCMLPLACFAIAIQNDHGCRY